MSRIARGLGIAAASLTALAWAGSAWARRGTSGPILLVGDSIANALYVPMVDVLGDDRVLVEARDGEGVGATAELLEARLGRHPEARVVVLSTGVNSLESYPAGELAARVKAIWRACRRSGRRCLVVGPVPAAAYRDGWGARLGAYRRSLRRAVPDLYDPSRALGDASGAWREGLGRPDRLHPSREGARRMARAIAARI